MDGNKAVVLSGDWINVAIINANQYNIEQVVQTKFKMLAIELFDC